MIFLKHFKYKLKYNYFFVFRFLKNLKYKNNFSLSNPNIKQLSFNKGFTLVEIVVATTIFAFTATAMMSLFNYTLKINRRSEALRQVMQGVRNFTELVVKEVRNGEIDYAVDHSNFSIKPVLTPCPRPVSSNPANNVYLLRENKIGLVTEEGQRVCIFLGDANGNSIASNIFSGHTLVLAKAGVPNQILNPPNFKVENLMFFIRPSRDPYYDPPPLGPVGGSLVRIQPFVTIVMKLVVSLPTGESQTIHYQTSVSSDKYDIPNNP